jgi:serine/threonine protein kinase
VSIKDYGRYSLLKKLATGGMAEVFLARQKSTLTGSEGFEKLCVIKRILPHLADDAEFVTMFLNEARIAARFTHPNIAQIFDLGKEEDTYYIAMEFVHGEDLGRVMRQAWSGQKWVPLPVELRIIAQACEGLHYAHTRTDEKGQPLKVVHRDVSPQNVLISFDGNAKIVDFGIARAADQVSTTRSGAIKGKFAYMSPEQASGKALDHRADQFAVGLVMYELLTGVRPLKRDSDLLTLKAAVDCQIPPPSKVADVPEDLDEVVLKALSKVADDRYPDTRSFQLAIESYIVKKGWTVTSAHVAEFMRELFADRLEKEAEAGGDPVVHGPDSQSGPPATGSFPIPQKLPTRPEYLVNQPAGAPELNPAALEEVSAEFVREEEDKPEPPEPPRPPDAHTPTGAGLKRRTTPRKQTLVPKEPQPRRTSGLRPVADFPAPEVREARRSSRIQPAAESARESESAPEPVKESRKSSSSLPRTRTNTSERKRKSVLYLSNDEIAEERKKRDEAARAEAGRHKLALAEDEDDGEPTSAQLRSPVQTKGLPRWILSVVVVALLLGALAVPSVRQQAAKLLASFKGGDTEDPEIAHTTALFLESNVQVEVFLGKEKLGVTPINGHLVPEGNLTLRLSNSALGVEREIALTASGSTVRHREQFSLGRVRFKADKDCEVFIGNHPVARVPGPLTDFYEGTYDAECRNEALGLIGRAKVVITKDRTKPTEASFKLVSVTEPTDAQK